MAFSKDWQDFIKELLKDYSQMDFALKTGVSQGTVSNWLKGKLPTDMSMVRNLAKAIELDPDDLEDKVRLWTVSTSLQADYNLSEKESLEIQAVLDKILAERKRKSKEG